MRKTVVTICHLGDQSGGFNQMKQHNILKVEALHLPLSRQIQNIY